MIASRSILGFIGTLFLAGASTLAPAQDHIPDLTFTEVLAAQDTSDRGTGTVEPAAGRGGKRQLKHAVIHPYRSCNVPAEVSGVIATFRHDAGDAVRAGQVVVTLTPDRFNLAVEGSRQRLLAEELTLKVAEERLKATEALLSQEWATQHKLAEAKEQVAVSKARVAAAKRSQESALVDMEACTVKAPFDGQLAVRYKEPFEAAERLERLFLLIDTSKVYAVADLPEELLGGVKKGARAGFTTGSGRRYSGTIERIGILVNPESRSTRVWLLIDNPDASLVVGMTGTLSLE